MAVTIVIVRRKSDGHGRRVVADITGPASYTTAGELLTAAQQAALTRDPVATVDMTKLEVVSSEKKYVAAGAHVYEGLIDKGTNKFVFTDKGVEVVNTTDLSGVTVRIEFAHGASIV